MATTNIELDIENITGVADADDQFVISAQKFVVASIPKNLLKWAARLTEPTSHGGNTSQGINIVVPTATDSILDVSRNGFSATEVPYEMKGFIANSSSLHLATNTYPKYYLDNAVTDKGVIVSVKPIPTDSATARVLYVDNNKIDDDCDLRNAVIFHASSKEFSQLATDGLYSWTSPSAPVAPASPSFTYTDASVNDMIKPLIDISDMASMTESAPTYTAPVLESRVAFSNFSTTVPVSFSKDLNTSFTASFIIGERLL